LSEKGLLLYCIADNFDESLLSIKGLEETSSISAFEYKGMYAVISAVSLDEYGEESMQIKGEDVGWLTEKACRFMEIMQSINEKVVVIPMKFLTLFTSEQRIVEVIDENYEDFKDTFNKLSGREELSVKIYCSDKAFKETSMGEEIAAFEKTLAGKPKGAIFFLRKKFDGELDSRVQDKICKIANSIVEEAVPLCIEMKSLKLLAKEITGVKERMVLNCAFLVDSKEKDKFRSYFQEAKEKYKASGFNIECLGPWPPYDFCSK
jgi:hypothetical protein